MVGEILRLHSMTGGNCKAVKTFSFGEVGLSTGSTNEEIAGLDGESCFFDAYPEFADSGFGREL
jgi:hypothetical protein